MKICHVSDTHGLFPVLDDSDVVVHSGDLLPNRTRGIRVIEEPFQRQWVIDRRGKFQRWIGERPFLYCAGNHDYIDPCSILRECGLDAVNINNDYVVRDGVSFFGFPFVKYFTGEWNYELSEPELKTRLDRIRDLEIDVFVSHGPMRGVLDRNGDGERCGSTAIREFLQTIPVPPKLFLFGHIHESNGHQMWSRGIMCSNAATTQRVLTL